jgi:hypothetical protein
VRKYDQYKGVSDIISKLRELAAKSSNQWLKEDLKQGDWRADGWESDPIGSILPYLSELSPQLKQDMGKVEFDWENYTSATDLIDMAWRSRHPHIKDEYGYSFDIMGPHNRMGSEGVSWIGCAAGGDWEEPVFFMLYMDQGQVRAWIPKDGNCWNRTTKQAFGNDEDADPKDIKEQIKKSGKYPELLDKDFEEDGFYDYVDYIRDSNEILKGIKEHFEARPHVVPKY